MLKKIKSGFVLSLAVLLCLLTFTACGSKNNEAVPSKQSQQTQETQKKDLTGKLIIYAAGSLSVPFEELKKEFGLLYPNVNVQIKSGGSVDLAKGITELGEKVDVFASADYKVIQKSLMPENASFNIPFAKNSMVIMYTDKSKFADEINSDNWYDILLKNGVNYGHSVPDSDPCGYRAVLTWQLAEKFYNKPGLYDKLVKDCPAKNIRPKSVELISLLETGGLDYAFEYESVAIQHESKDPKFKHISLPEDINFSTIDKADFYKNSSIELKGSKPNETVKTFGEPIVYSVTMPNKGENKENAKAFLSFMLDKGKGLKIIEKTGQPIIKDIKPMGDNIPSEIKKVIQ